MKLFTAAIEKRLLENGNPQQPLRCTDEESDFESSVTLFTADAACAWLLTTIDPENPDTAFGLCDPGMDFSDFGAGTITELRVLRGRLGLPVERDLYSRPARYSRAKPPKPHGSAASAPAALEEGAASHRAALSFLSFLTIRSKRPIHASPFSSCSQILMTWKPSLLSCLRMRLSRRRFESIFVVQYSALLAGSRPHFGQACQKQPSTNTASFDLGK